MNPQFNEIGQAFVKQYYATFDADRTQLASFYNEYSLFTFEGTSVMGRESIMKHITEKLTFKQCVHAATSVDCQPTARGGIFVQVMGQLKTDGEEHAMGYCQAFTLENDPAGQSWFVANDIFRLVIHNG
eukprot:m.57586 g.57586  ORF g.57586 m.57586 type:complete len:129 (+) comp22410_c0_seq1:79-465(+)